MSTQCMDGAWELPEFKMNAGETKFLRLPIYNNSNQLIDAAGMSGRLSISDYVNRGVCLQHIDCSTGDDDQCGGSIFMAQLLPQHTIDLCGKYIYQLTAKDYDGTVGVLRGIVFINHNADKEAIKEGAN